MTQRFFIGCTLPSLNQVIDAAKVRNGSWSRYAEMKVMYESMIKSDIKKAKLRPMKRPVMILYHWVEKDMRRDADNIVAGGKKFVNDSLVSLGILTTDARSQVIGFRDTFEVDKENPGCWVTLEEVAS